jgi:hypothetical protein
MATIADGEDTVTVSIDAASNQTAGAFASFVHPDTIQVFLQNISSFAALTGNVTDGALTISRAATVGDIDVSWMVLAENNSLYIRSLNTVDGDGHAIVEFNKPAGDASLLDDREETVKEEEARADETYTEIVPELIGTTGYPLHAQAIGSGAVPMRTVTRHVINFEGEEFEA